MNNQLNASKNKDEERRITAYHEAAHAVMCIWKNVPVFEVEVFDKPREDRAIGVCRSSEPKSWRDTVWISLAGPVMDAIQLERPFFLNDAPGCRSDIEAAWGAYLSVLAPRPPVVLSKWLPTEVCSNLTTLVDAYEFEGWRPEGLSGQLKRKMTMYCRKYGEALDFIHERLQDESASIIRFMRDTPAFMKCVTEIAERLLRKSKLTCEEIYESCRVATA